MNKKVLVFGGGTGISFLLRGLKLFPLDITNVITVADNGSSTGKLREEFLMPAMGDIRKVLTNLSNTNQTTKQLMEYRFDTYSDLNGHPVGNLLLSALYNMTDNFKTSIEILSDILNVKQKVLPLSEDYLTLMGETLDGKIVEGEYEITASNQKYKKLFYKKEPTILPEVLLEIKKADVIIFSIGSLYTSIIPHLLSKDIIKAIDNSNAKLLYVCNALTQPGETDKFSVSDHINVINSYLGEKKLDATLVSKTKLPKEIIKHYYDTEKKEIVRFDNRANKLCEIIESDLLIIEENVIRHDPLKTATAIFNYVLR